MDQTSSPSPETLYANRLDACRREVERRRLQHRGFGYLRLLWAVIMAVIAWFAFVRHALAWEWLALPWLGFAATAYFHTATLRAGARAQRGAAWFAQGLARLEDRWAGLRPRTPRVDTASSLFATDLDLFGPASLFELLCSARSTLGEDTLARWLLEPAGLEEIAARQAAVRDLRDRSGLREDVASAAGPDSLAIHPDALRDWAAARQPALPAWLIGAAPTLMILTLAAVAWWAVQHSPLPLLVMLALDVSITYTVQRSVNALFAQAQQATRDLALLADLLSRFESEHFDAPRLQALQAKLCTGAHTASRTVRHLANLSRANFMRNGLLRLLDLPLLYSVQLALLVQRWRRHHGHRLPDWLDSLGQLEALLSLSAYHFEHPRDAFPEIVAGEPLYAAEALGHPLLPQETCVRNGVLLDNSTRLLLVSGSNMSGKSTLLRSVGVSAVMAMAGAPVRAHRLQLCPLHIAASIQIHDSLQSGRSRFYAEILRLRAICDMARAHPPLLFLLDELLAGTNSHDRLAGATGVVRELLASGAIGLLSTHDLALTGITGPTAGLLRNVHFEDRISGDQLHFDYTLRPGIVTRSNGLELMRLIGLDVQRQI